MSTETMDSLAHRTVASAKQLQSLTHRMRRAKQEKVSTSNPPLTESVRGGKKLTPFILLYGRCSFGEAKRFLFCVRSAIGAPPVNVWVSFAEEWIGTKCKKNKHGPINNGAPQRPRARMAWSGNS